MLVACFLNLVKCIILQVAPFPCLCTHEFCEWGLQCSDMREVATNIVDTPEKLLKLLFAGGCGEIGNMCDFLFGWCNPISFNCVTQNFVIIIQEVTFIHPKIEVVRMSGILWNTLVKFHAFMIEATGHVKSSYVLSHVLSHVMSYVLSHVLSHVMSHVLSHVMSHVMSQSKSHVKSHSC